MSIETVLHMLSAMCIESFLLLKFVFSSFAFYHSLLN